MRIVWLSNAPWCGSGYGEQTALFLPRLQALGHDMALAANFGLQGAKFDLGNLTVYPANDNWGNTSIQDFAEHHQADLVVALCDTWVMNPDMWPHVRMAIWAPIDHYPIPPAVLKVLQNERVQPIAMSRDGEGWMNQFGLDPLYVPHGVDTKLFQPHPERKQAVRRELGIPEDAFLVGMVAANKGSPQFPRKGFPQAFDAFARFARRHPDAWMYVHTTARRNGNSGIDLDTLALAVECPKDRVRFPPDTAWNLGMSKEIVANLYHAFDVLLNPSMGEGFGIPIIEAQASGCPVIASDHSAMTELTQAGWLVTGDRWWDPLQESFATVPSIGSVEAALDAAYDARDDIRLREAAVAFAQEYDADRVTVEYWQPALERLERPVEIPPLQVNGNRAQRRAAKRKKVKV